ncbi:MAG: hypothetical protein AB8D52_00670 [Gammaproteobacteria bacterium]
MKKLLNSKWVVLGLAICAIASLVQSIALPLLQTPAFDSVAEEFIDPLLDASTEIFDQATSDNPAIKQSIDIDNLSVVTKPKRNPFQALPVTKEFMEKDVKKKKEQKVVTRTPVINPRLDAIIINDGARYAVLDSKIITSGDSFGEFHIESIQSNHIDLTGPEGPVRLHLTESSLEKNHEAKK